MRGSPSPTIVNQMAGKSPKAASVFTRPCRSHSSNTEKFAFSTPMPGASVSTTVAVSPRARLRERTARPSR